MADCPRILLFCRWKDEIILEWMNLTNMVIIWNHAAGNVQLGNIESTRPVDFGAEMFGRVVCSCGLHL